MVAMNAHQVRLLHRRGTRRPRAAVEQSDLTKQFARLKDVEHDLVPIERAREDPHPTREDAIQAIPRIAFAEYLAVCLELATVVNFTRSSSARCGIFDIKKCVDRSWRRIIGV
jgi:hypothetical protein